MREDDFPCRLVPYMAEAIRMLERGDASVEDIDSAMRLGAGKSNTLFLVSWHSELITSLQDIVRNPTLPNRSLDRLT